MIYYIYKIYPLRGSLAGKYYIGQHRTKNLNDGYAGSGTILRNYYKAHGCVEGETYNKEIIQFCSSIAELNRVEKAMVADLYDTDPNCINLIAGGRGKGFSRETRKKISEAGKGRIVQEDMRERIAKKLQGHKVSEETREKIRSKIIELNKSPEFRKKNSEGQKKRKPITEETRTKIAEAGKGRPCCWRGKKMPKAITEKMSASQKGFRYINNGIELKRVKSPQLEMYLAEGWVLGMRECDIKKSAEKRKGRHLSEETKKKLSATNRGRKMPEEIRAKLAELNRARANDPEIRKKISEAKKGKRHSPEHTAKVAAAKRGVPQSEETKRKRSEAMRGKHWYFDKQLNRRVYV